MIKLKELIQEETKHACECGGDCCKTTVNESLQLPNGTKIEMGKLFTGQGKAFVKEEDLNEEVVPVSKSDIKKMEKLSEKIIKDSETLLKMFRQKHKVSTRDSVLYNTSKDWEQAIRTLKMKFGGWFGFVHDSDYIK